MTTVGQLVSVIAESPLRTSDYSSVRFDSTSDRVFLANLIGLDPYGLHAYHPVTGLQVWSRTQSAGAIFAPPAFDPTGNIMAISGGPLSDFRMVVLTVATGGELASIDSSTGILPAGPAFSPDGRLLVYMSGKPGSAGSLTTGLITARETADPRRIRWTKDVHTPGGFLDRLGFVRPLVFSPDSTLVGINTPAGTTVLRADSGELVQSPELTPGFGGVFSADGSRVMRVVVAAEKPTVLKQFDIGTGRLVAQTVLTDIVGSTATLPWAAFSEDRRLVAVRGERAAIFDVGASRPRFSPVEPWRYPIKFSPGGTFYSSVRTLDGQRHMVSLNRTDTGADVWHAVATAGSLFHCLDFSPDGRYFTLVGTSDLTGTSRQGVFVVAVGDPPVPMSTKFAGSVHLQKDLPSAVSNVAVGRGARAPAVVTTMGGVAPNDPAGQEVWVVGADEGEIRRRVPVRGVITAMDDSDDTSCVALGSSDGGLRLVGTAGGGGDWTGRHGGAVNAVAVTGDGRLIASGGSDRRARLFARVLSSGESHDDRRPQWTSALHPRGITRIALSTSGKWIATGCSDGSVRLFTVAGVEPVRVLATQAKVTALAFAADRLLAVGLDSGSVRVLETGSAQAPTSLAHPGPVSAVRFNHDNTLLAVGAGVPGGVRVWPAAASSNPVLALGFSSAVTDLAFSPVNNILIVALDAADVAVIDADTGNGDRRLFTGPASALRFASDGRLLAVASDARMTIFNAAHNAALREPPTA